MSLDLDLTTADNAERLRQVGCHIGENLDQRQMRALCERCRTHSRERRQPPVGGHRDPALRQSGRNAAGAEAEDGGVTRPRAAERLQLCPGDGRGREADAVAEQQRQHVHQDLVDEAPLQALAGHIGTEDLEVLAARGVQCSSGLWERRNMGPVKG